MARYRLMCQQLVAEPEANQKAIAKRLGISQPYLSKLADPDFKGSIGLGLVELAIEGFGISPQFFFDPRLTTPHFRAYAGPRSLPKVNYPALDRFLQQLQLEEDDVPPPTPEELAQLEQIYWDGDPTPTTYRHYLAALRSVKHRSITVVKTVPKPKSAS